MAIRPSHGRAAMMGAVAAAFLAALVVIPALERWARARSLLDIPNERSSHTQPTPRVGGVGIVAGMVTGQLAWWALGYPMMEHVGVLSMAAVALAALGFADDLKSLRVRVRLVAQGVVAGLVVWQAASPALLPFSPSVPALSQILLWVWLVGLVNAYNFMDGIDGIAGGQAVVAAAGWAVVGLACGLPGVSGVALCLAAVCAAFLRYNWPPARVFMGDGGSKFLGFAFAAIPLGARLPAGVAVLTAGCFVWPFLFDTVFTFCRRLLRGENVFRPHRSHLYQRLTVTGLTHTQVSGLYMALSALGLPAGVCLAIGRWIPGLVFASAVPLAAVGLWLLVMRREARVSGAAV